MNAVLSLETVAPLAAEVVSVVVAAVASAQKVVRRSSQVSRSAAKENLPSQKRSRPKSPLLHHKKNQLPLTSRIRSVEGLAAVNAVAAVVDRSVTPIALSATQELMPPNLQATQVLRHQISRPLARSLPSVMRRSHQVRLPR